MKLEIPSSFRRPDPEDAGPQIEQACDWIEAEALFFSSPVTRADAGDFLEESGLLGRTDSRLWDASHLFSLPGVHLFETQHAASF